MTTITNENHLIQEITPRNILSFGPDTAPIKLGKLNVLIGPNGSGKSNLIDVIRLLRSYPRDVRQTILKGGGVTDWIWKGAPYEPAMIDALISKTAQLRLPPDVNWSSHVAYNTEAHRDVNIPIRHSLSFRPRTNSFSVVSERIKNDRAYDADRPAKTFYRYADGVAIANAIGENGELQIFLSEPDQSVLKQLRDPRSYPELSYLASTYEKIRIYSDWSFGREASFRSPQSTDTVNLPLAEDLSNLWLFLNTIRQNSKAKNAVIEKLKDLYAGITDFDSSIVGSTILGYISEGDFNIFPRRLSDGTLRYISLLAILCDPSPPPLVCIEEPEIGLHPDILPSLADLLVEASDRTQIIVTTHSDILVDALTEHPEAILVAEKHNGQTVIQHLDPDEIKIWLEKYRLGELWLSGQLGGSRW